MAIEYDLYLTSDRAIPDLIALVATRPGFARDGSHYRAAGVGGSAYPVQESRRRALREQVGVDPVSGLSFRMAGDAVTGVAPMLAAVFALLKDLDGDAVLLFGGQATILIRAKGKVLVNLDSEFWTKDRMALIPGKYESVRLPSLQ